MHSSFHLPYTSLNASIHSLTPPRKKKIFDLSPRRSVMEYFPSDSGHQQMARSTLALQVK